VPRPGSSVENFASEYFSTTPDWLTLVEKFGLSSHLEDTAT